MNQCQHDNIEYTTLEYVTHIFSWETETYSEPKRESILAVEHAECIDCGSPMPWRSSSRLGKLRRNLIAERRE